MAKRRTKAENETAALIETSVTDAIYAGIVRDGDDWRRDHFGASGAGHKCDRYLWQQFRWALAPDHDGRQLRLFKRGDQEETRVVHDLMVAGMDVQDADNNGDQFRVRWGHVGGSCDGKVWGVPGVPDPLHMLLLEIKTFGAKSFAYLKANKLRKAKPEHFTQVQLYMHGLQAQGEDITQCLYIAVHKDTDEIYVQVIDYDEPHASKLLARASDIVAATEPPPKLDPDVQFSTCVMISKDGTRWPCDHFELCHGKKMPERNCRTCVSSSPEVTDKGEPFWACNHPDMATELTPELQRQGCHLQCSIPPIVNGEVVTMHETSEGKRTVVYQFADGEQVKEQ